MIANRSRPSAPPGQEQPAADPLPVVVWRQWRTERSLRRRGIDFRTTDPAAVRRAYAAMTPDEFAAINGRQGWANARTIFRSLDGLLPVRPIFALDLGSGTGESARNVAVLCPPGSRVVGIEFAEQLVEVARAHKFRTAGPRPTTLSYVVGSVTETFRNEQGRPIPDGSVDLVNASGIVGHHLEPRDAARLATESSRVLRRGGIAALDVGPKMSSAELTALMASLGFVRLRRTRSNPFDPTGQVVFRRG